MVVVVSSRYRPNPAWVDEMVDALKLPIRISAKQLSDRLYCHLDRETGKSTLRTP